MPGLIKWENKDGTKEEKRFRSAMTASDFSVFLRDKESTVAMEMYYRENGTQDWFLIHEENKETGLDKWHRRVV